MYVTHYESAERHLSAVLCGASGSHESVCEADGDWSDNATKDQVSVFICLSCICDVVDGLLLYRDDVCVTHCCSVCKTVLHYAAHGGHGIEQRCGMLAIDCSTVLEVLCI